MELVPPGAILICLDTNLKWSQWMIVILISSMVVAEFVSFGVSYGIMKTLSKNSRGFSAKTYRMHRQLTYLLVAQVSFIILWNSTSLFYFKDVLIAPDINIYIFKTRKFETSGRKRTPGVDTEEGAKKIQIFSCKRKIHTGPHTGPKARGPG